MTAAQKRARAKTAYNGFLAACPSQQLLQRISGKWVMLILAALGSASSEPRVVCDGEPGPLRYSELSRLLAGASPKMLTQTLRLLEEDGLVSRSVAATVPATVTYDLTELRLSLLQMMRGIKTWAESQMDDVTARRAKHGTAGA